MQRFIWMLKVLHETADANKEPLRVYIQSILKIILLLFTAIILRAQGHIQK